MLDSLNQPTLLVTNPLHYIYLSREFSLPAIGSTHNSLLVNNAGALGFGENLTLLDTKNSLEDLALRWESINPNTSQYYAWKPVNLPLPFLSNSYAVASPLEDKATIRTILPAQLFPKYIVVPPEEAASLSYQGLQQKLNCSCFVVQLAHSTGGKGTFFIRTSEEFDVLRDRLLQSGQPLVCSELITGTSRALQYCLLGDQLLAVDWWHQDLVAIEGICNLAAPHATRYCGAIVENIPEAYKAQVEQLSQEVAKALTVAGYQGVFGIDVVVDEIAQKVYLIEVNPRFTAVSHLYASLMRAVGYPQDFMTLAILWSLGKSSSQQAGGFDVRLRLPSPYYYLKVQNLGMSEAMFGPVKLGIYAKDGKYSRFGFDIEDLDRGDEIIVIPEGNIQTPYQPGDRIFSIIGRGNIVENGTLTIDTRRLVSTLLDQFKKL